MNNIIVLTVTAVLVSGCSLLPTVTTDVQTVNVPVLYCPAPPEFYRPQLAIDLLSSSQLSNDGDVVQAYAASMIQLIGYAKGLEDALQFYRTASDNLETKSILNVGP